MKAKTSITFAELPRDYAGLCGVLTPRLIRDRTDYANIVEIADAMAVHAAQFSTDQEDYFDLLCALLERWDAEHVKWRKLKPADLLRQLAEDHGLSGADVSRIVGASSRHLGAMILRGERQITAAHARKLGEWFKLDPGAFIA